MKSTDGTTSKRLAKSIKQYKEGQFKRLTLNPVRYARTRLQLTQKQFATLLGVSVRTLQYWEQGQKAPNKCVKILVQIAINSPEVFDNLEDDVAPPSSRH